MLPSYWPHDFDIPPESDPFKYWVGNRSVLEPMKLKYSVIIDCLPDQMPATQNNSQLLRFDLAYIKLQTYRYSTFYVGEGIR